MNEHLFVRTVYHDALAVCLASIAVLAATADDLDET